MIFVQRDGQSGRYDYLNHAVHNLLQFQTKPSIVEKGSGKAPEPNAQHCHTVPVFKVLLQIHCGVFTAQEAEAFFHGRGQ